MGRSAVAVNGTRGSVVDIPALIGKDKGFGVFGYYNNSSATDQSFNANLFNNQEVIGETSTETGQKVTKWTYTPVRYWPTDGHVDFLAYAPYDTKTALKKTTDASGAASKNTSCIDFEVASTIADQKDLLWANAENKTKDNLTENKVKFQFGHALSRLGYTVKLNKTVPADEATITLKRIALAGSANEDAKAFYTKATIDLSKTTGLWSDYATGRQNFEWLSKSHIVTTGTTAIHPNEDRAENEDYLFVIPQKFKTGSDHLYVIVEYTIEYKSGTAKPTVSYKVSQQLPYDFEQGKAYKINLTIGLNPIEFNADVTAWGNASDYDIDSWE